MLLKTYYLALVLLGTATFSSALPIADVRKANNAEGAVQSTRVKVTNTVKKAPAEAVGTGFGRRQFLREDIELDLRDLEEELLDLRDFDDSFDLEERGIKSVAKSAAAKVSKTVKKAGGAIAGAAHKVVNVAKGKPPMGRYGKASKYGKNEWKSGPGMGRRSLEDDELELELRNLAEELLDLRDFDEDFDLDDRGIKSAAKSAAAKVSKTVKKAGGAIAGAAHKVVNVAKGKPPMGRYGKASKYGKNEWKSGPGMGRRSLEDDELELELRNLEEELLELRDFDEEFGIEDQ